MLKGEGVTSTKYWVFLTELLSLRELNGEAEPLFLIMLKFEDIPELQSPLFLSNTLGRRASHFL
jgi:hypothetical protein